MSLVTQEIRASAQVYHGDAICQEMCKVVFTDMGLPNGLLPLKDVVECGYVKETGFMWIIQKKPKVHKFEKIGVLTSYATEVTGVIEKFKMKKLTGVKSKNFLMWIPVGQISVDDPPTGKITFTTTSGFFRTFPVSAFVIEDGKKVGVNLLKDDKVDEVKKDVAQVKVAKETQAKEV